MVDEIFVNSTVCLGLTTSLHSTQRRDGMCFLEVGSPPPDTASLSHGPDLKEENLYAASGQRWRGSPDEVMLSFLVVSALGQGGSPLSLGGTRKTGRLV